MRWVSPLWTVPMRTRALMSSPMMGGRGARLRRAKGALQGCRELPDQEGAAGRGGVLRECDLAQTAGGTASMHARAN